MGRFPNQWTKEELITYVMNGEFRTKIMNKYGVPGFDMKDGAANIQAGTGGWGGDTGTSFPVTVMIAFTWNKDLAHDYGTAIGQEGTAMGTEAWYAPSINIHRNPLCGRNFEYYSEDPILSGTMSAEAVKDAQENGVQATLKHFAANNQEWGRAGLRTILTERAFREIYLKSFEIPVKAGATGIMGAFNFLGNVWCNADPALITDLLRTEWGFDGYQDISTTTFRAWDDAPAMMYAGTDLFLSSHTSRNNRYEAEYQELSDEYDNVPEFRAVLQENVKHTFKVIMKTYAFSDIIGNTDNVNYVAPESWFGTVKSCPETYRTIIVIADDIVTVNLDETEAVAGDTISFSIGVTGTDKK